MIKRISAAVLALLMLLSMLSCNKKDYEPVLSTEEERKTVFVIGEYEVPYELFRTFFLASKNRIDGGDKSVWIGSSAPEYREKAIELIIPQICELYAVFSVCQANGIDIYSEEIENQIKEMVKISVEGGTLDGIEVLGYESYEEYLAHLKTMYMNDSVSRFIIRQSLCETAVKEAFKSNFVFEKEDVRDFFESDDCARITWLYRTYYYSEFFTPEDDYNLAKKAHNALSKAENFSDVINIFVQYSSAEESHNVEKGFYIGENTLDFTYNDVAKAVFSMKEGEYSDVIDTSYGVCVVYRMKKDAKFLDNSDNFELISELYIDNCFYEIVEGCKERLVESIRFSDFFNNLNFAEIEY